MEGQVALFSGQLEAQAPGAAQACHALLLDSHTQSQPLSGAAAAAVAAAPVMVSVRKTYQLPPLHDGGLITFAFLNDAHEQEVLLAAVRQDRLTIA